MLTKDPPKVKSVIEESPITQKCKSQEIVHTLRKLRFDIYIIVESLPESLDFVGGEGGGGGFLVEKAWNHYSKILGLSFPY